MTLVIIALVGLGLAYLVRDIAVKFGAADAQLPLVNRVWSSVRSSATTLSAHICAILSGVPVMLAGVAEMLGDPDVKAQLAGFVAEIPKEYALLVPFAMSLLFYWVRRRSQGQ